MEKAERNNQNKLAEEAAKEIHFAFRDYYDDKESEIFWWTNTAQKISPKLAKFLNELIVNGHEEEAKRIASLVEFYAFIKEYDKENFKRYSNYIKIIHEYGEIRTNKKKMQELREKSKQFSKRDRFKPALAVREYLAKKYPFGERGIREILQKYRGKKLKIYKPDPKQIESIKKVLLKKTTTYRSFKKITS